MWLKCSNAFRATGCSKSSARLWGVWTACRVDSFLSEVETQASDRRSESQMQIHCWAKQDRTQIRRLSLVYLASARRAAVQPDSRLPTAGSKLQGEVGRLPAQAGCHLSPHSLALAPPWDAPICLLLISLRQGVQGRTSGYSDANAAVVELNFLISSMPLCLSRASGLQQSGLSHPPIST